MNVLRTILWVLMTAVVVAFVVMNWGEPQSVRLWPGDQRGPLMFEWPVGFIALAFFLAGLVPMWLFHRGSKWRLQRRIHTLENAARANAIAPASPSAPAHSSEPVASASGPAGHTEVAERHPAATHPAPVEGAPVPRDEILR